MFLISLHYKQPLEEVERHLDAHIAFLERYYASGHFLCSGRKQPRTGGVILMRASGLEEAERIMAEDPFYTHKIAEYQLTEFIPSKCAPGLEAWFLADNGHAS
ncbi:GTP cyclohydrolase [Paenibacillus athensensis]|uniref:GTP cyclohydrolase n=1 Tax=Paenibacillus athensensis TaxID=1967502 RepID=A0A4Y8PVZ1_9BACL|nr:GTP cyclohydrolase [Paenibacillus athensensis]